MIVRDVPELSSDPVNNVNLTGIGDGESSVDPSWRSCVSCNPNSAWVVGQSRGGGSHLLFVFGLRLNGEINSDCNDHVLMANDPGLRPEVAAQRLRLQPRRDGYLRFAGTDG